MKRLFGVALLLVPFILLAQGVRKDVFVNGLDWQEIQDKARSQKKFIFLDCFASWCIPCKEMDKDVYADEKVGDFLRDNFISVKVQMDSVKGGSLTDTCVKNAEAIKKQYGVDAYPTFLFFSSDGKIVHKDQGYHSRDEFMKVMENSIDSSRQYYTLLQKYNNQKLAFSSMPYLADKAKSLSDDSLSYSIAKDYIDRYLLGLPDSLLFSGNNLQFIADHVSLRDTMAFNFVLRSRQRIDAVMASPDTKKFSESVIDGVVSDGDIYPRLFKNKDLRMPIVDDPDWHTIYSIIMTKYGSEIADKAILNARITWFEKKKDWDKVILYELEKISIYGLDTMGINNKVQLNNLVWYHVFMHSTDRRILKTAITWMRILSGCAYVKNDLLFAGWLDTYANVLYKAGHIAKAKQIEIQAIKLDPGNGDFTKALENFKLGVPTWM